MASASSVLPATNNASSPISFTSRELVLVATSTTRCSNLRSTASSAAVSRCSPSVVKPTMSAKPTTQSVVPASDARTPHNAYRWPALRSCRRCMTSIASWRRGTTSSSPRRSRPMSSLVPPLFASGASSAVRICAISESASCDSDDPNTRAECSVSSSPKSSRLHTKYSSRGRSRSEKLVTSSSGRPSSVHTPAGKVDVEAGSFRDLGKGPPFATTHEPAAYRDCMEKAAFDRMTDLCFGRARTRAQTRAAARISSASVAAGSKP